LNTNVGLGTCELKEKELEGSTMLRAFMHFSLTPLWLARRLVVFHTYSLLEK
jgi:hypothetical protein